ncbi:MAG TPA: nuclear transport factor 2 family protein [Myxococcota bacterium]|nr:nuclear transport factor 2 family protein [Myxococcota bacterium]
MAAKRTKARRKSAAARKRTPRTKTKAQRKPAAERRPSLEATNTALARRFLDAVSRADIDAIVAAYAPSGTCWTAGSMPISGTYGVAQVSDAARGVLTVFPEGLRFTIHALTAQGERVAIEAESYGRHVSGKIYNNKYHFLMRARGGKIVEWREYMDTMHANEVLCGGAGAARS